MDRFNVEMIPRVNLVVSATKEGDIIVSNRDAGIHLWIKSTPKGLMIEIVGEGYIELGPNGPAITPEGCEYDLGPAVNAFVKK